MLPQIKDSLKLLFYLWHQHCWFGQQAIGTKTRALWRQKQRQRRQRRHTYLGGWGWVPDRRCLVDQEVVAAYRKKHPLPESLQPPCDGDSPPCGSPQHESSEGDRTRQHGDLKRSLSQGDIQERMSSCSQEMFSPQQRLGHQGRQAPALSSGSEETMRGNGVYAATSTRPHTRRRI